MDVGQCLAAGGRMVGNACEPAVATAKANPAKVLLLVAFMVVFAGVIVFLINPNSFESLACFGKTTSNVGFTFDAGPGRDLLQVCFNEQRMSISTDVSEDQFPPNNYGNDFGGLQKMKVVWQAKVTNSDGKTVKTLSGTANYGCFTGGNPAQLHWIKNVCLAPDDYDVTLKWSTDNFAWGSATNARGEQVHQTQTTLSVGE